MDKRFQIYNGDCLEVMKTLADNSVDSIVTDPPAGISFMNKSWDSDKGGRDEWIAWLTSVMRESLRVLKPGGHALVWALPRTSHWTATALENAGFEIRDLINHLFGSGFPKSLDISKAIDKMHGAEREVLGVDVQKAKQQTKAVKTNSYGDYLGNGGQITAPATDEAKQWEGFGTALKPACEHWILCRKPLSEKTIAENVLKWGVGGLNIDACRVDVSQADPNHRPNWKNHSIEKKGNLYGKYNKRIPNTLATGRFPANVIHDGSDEVEAEFAKFGERKVGGGTYQRKPDDNRNAYSAFKGAETVSFGDSGSASRFFYCAKASKSDRGETNKHPTVKATPLMQYLCRLITPPDGIVLDCFMGSGSTGKAAMKEGFRFIGIELEKESCDEAQKRIESAIEPLFQTVNG